MRTYVGYVYSQARETEHYNTLMNTVLDFRSQADNVALQAYSAFGQADVTQGGSIDTRIALYDQAVARLQTAIALWQSVIDAVIGLRQRTENPDDTCLDPSDPKGQVQVPCGHEKVAALARAVADSKYYLDEAIVKKQALINERQKAIASRDGLAATKLGLHPFAPVAPTPGFRLPPSVLFPPPSPSAPAASDVPGAPSESTGLGWGAVALGLLGIYAVSRFI